MPSWHSVQTKPASRPLFESSLNVAAADGQIELLANLLLVQVAVEVDPFAAVRRPRLPAISLGNAAGNYGLFKLSQMLADHFIGSMACAETCLSVA